MFKRFLGTLALTAMLAACGSGGSDHTPTAGGGGLPGGGGGGGTPPDEPVYQLGAGTGSSFQAGAIGVGSTSLSAGGSTSLSVSVVDQTGALYTEEMSVTFSSNCIGQGRATVTTPVVTNTGFATTTYAATGCSGDDVITARTVADGQQLVATATVTVAEAAIGSIEFVSATPNNVGLRGSGRPETSIVVFRVRDASNGARADADVSFALQSSVGGVTLNPTTATSDANGLVQTVVNAGTVATTVSVTATVLDVTPAISTQSSPLTITTGIVDSNSISLSVQCSNVEAWDIDGTVVPVTVRMADRFNNPVPDNTAANFRAEGGAIVGECTTISTEDERGLCSANWRSQSPRPADGRATLLVTATGEESFVDGNGNGIFDDGENVWDDLGEPFVDVNEDDAYQFGEEYLDFGGNNGTRDPADGTFNGVLCSRTTAPACGTSQAMLVSDSNLIILSGSTAFITQVDANMDPVLTPGVTVPGNGAATVRFWVRDLHENVMPGGSTVAAQVSANGVSVAQPSSFAVPCTTMDAGVRGPGTVYTFTLTAGATPASGVLNVTVTTPSNVATSYQIPVN